MLTKWLRTRRSRAPRSDRFFRPQLEALEGRLAPSNVVPMDDHGHGPGHDHGPPGPHGPPPAAPVNNTIASGVNAHGSFNNSTITNSFNDTINNTIILMPTQQSAVGGLFSIGFALSAMNGQLGSLINDEVALAVDTYLDSFPPVAAALPSLASDINTLKAAIAANSLESSPFGAAIGTLAYDVTLHALTSAQPAI